MALAAVGTDGAAEGGDAMTPLYATVQRVIDRLPAPDAFGRFDLDAGNLHWFVAEVLREMLAAPERAPE